MVEHLDLEASLSENSFLSCDLPLRPQRGFGILIEPQAICMDVEISQTVEGKASREKKRILSWRFVRRKYEPGVFFALDPSSLLVLHQHLWQVRSEANPAGGSSPAAPAAPPQNLGARLFHFSEQRICYSEGHTQLQPVQDGRRHVFCF